MFQLNALFKKDFGLGDVQRSSDSPARQLLEVDGFWPQAFGEAGFGKLREIVESANTPRFECLPHFIGEREGINIEACECLGGFFRNDGDTRKVVRGEN